MQGHARQDPNTYVREAQGGPSAERVIQSLESPAARGSWNLRKLIQRIPKLGSLHDVGG
jgi:hypothetical protein